MLMFFLKITYSDLILSPETRPGGFCSPDVSRSSLVFLEREILTPKSLSGAASCLHPTPMRLAVTLLVFPYTLLIKSCCLLICQTGIPELFIPGYQLLQFCRTNR